MSSVPEIVARSLAVARERSHGLRPSPEAIAWGKRQASTSPHWSDAKWRQVGMIFGFALSPEGAPAEQDQAEDDQAPETLRDAA